MKKYFSVISLCMFFCLFAGCVTFFPSENVSLKFSNKAYPIMLTPVETNAVMDDAYLNSGYKIYSNTATSSYGDTTVSVTTEIGTSVNYPFNQQINNLFIGQPVWIAITDFTLKNYLSIRFSTTETSYLSHLDIITPVSGE